MQIAGTIFVQGLYEATGRLTINASPTSVPMAMAIIKRKISWYALNRVSGTKAIPTNPHNDIIEIETTAAIQANERKKNQMQ